MPEVKLVLEDLTQVNFLERALVDANIPYKIELREPNYGLPKPYLLVDGVPLDMFRSLKWIKEQNNEC